MVKVVELRQVEKHKSDWNRILVGQTIKGLTIVVKEGLSTLDMRCIFVLTKYSEFRLNSQ